MLKLILLTLPVGLLSYATARSHRITKYIYDLHSARALVNKCIMAEYLAIKPLNKEELY